MDSTTLHQQVNDLAMKFMLAGPAEGAAAGTEWLARLEEIVRDSAAQGLERVAAEGRAIGRRLARLAPGSPEFRDALETGIRSLEESMEHPPAGEEPPAAPAAQAALAQDPELLADFVLESREHLRTIEENVLALEQSRVRAIRSTPFSAPFTPSRASRAFLNSRKSASCRTKPRRCSRKRATDGWSRGRR